MRFIILTIAALASHSGCIMAEELVIPEDKNVIVFDSKLGDVSFAHQKHAGLSITRCATCHHKYQPTDTVMIPCHQCHKHKAEEAAQAGAPKTKKALHTRCIGCHEYTVASGVQAGPVKKKCKLCHIQ